MKRIVLVYLVALHDDPKGHSDHLARLWRLVELAQGAGTPERDGSVCGKQFRHVLGLRLDLLAVSGIEVQPAQGPLVIEPATPNGRGRAAAAGTWWAGYTRPMLELVPESREALAEIIKLEDPQLDEELVEMGRMARGLVPELVGLSICVLSEGVTFTLVAPNSAVAALDAAQYIDGGPCVDAVTEPGNIIETGIEDLLDEDRWTIFARSSAAAGVASSLSMAITDGEGQVTGGLNLYASTAGAFNGLHETLAAALGGTAESVVTNADLGFASLERAKQAPAVLRDRARIETAVGILAARYREDVERARDRLLRAAHRASVDPVIVARVLIFAHLD